MARVRLQQREQIAMSELYRVPKREVSVKIRTTKGNEETVSLFLSLCAEDHAGPEQPSDYFNGSAEFLVAKREDGAMVFLRRGSLSVVTLELDDELAELLAGADLIAGDLAIEKEIELEFEDGLVLEGTTRFQRPEAQARIQDHLNSPEPFLLLYSGDRVHLVNKACVARVIAR
jgi:hypothetical protein